MATSIFTGTETLRACKPSSWHVCRTKIGKDENVYGDVYSSLSLGGDCSYRISAKHKLHSMKQEVLGITNSLLSFDRIWPARKTKKIKGHADTKTAR
jgi:hypothetical protein